MIFYISDLHFGQDTICQREGRPFNNVEEMDRVLIERWNSRVSMDDIVYVIGDFILRGEEYWGEYLDKLKGRIVLLRGNHDPEGFSAETRSHFEKIADYLEIEDAGRHVILCHYPIPLHKHDYDKNTWMLYGHVHNSREYEFLRRLRKELKATCTNPWRACGNFINVGCLMPWMDYYPRTLDELIANNGENE